MRRREFLSFLGWAAAANGWPNVTVAQPKAGRIGFLGSATAPGSARSIAALREGLNALGYVEGKNIVIEFRFAEGEYERLPQLAAELLRLNVDVLVTHGTPGTQIAKRATANTPIVMAISGDAVATGIVTNLRRPEANVTGSTFFLPELNAKRLELLREVLPHITHVGVLSNPANPVSRPIIPAMSAAAVPLRLEVEAFRVQGPSDFDGAFEAIRKSHANAVAVTEDGEFAASFKAIAALAIKGRLPSIGSKEYAEAGGLIGYGVDILSLYRRAAYFVDKILKGAKPAELPVEQPTRFEFVINLKTARTLGLNIPPILLARADAVIE
jgi:putative tryptophan/tyrosine transport system substrate-binding protein